MKHAFRRRWDDGDGDGDKGGGKGGGKREHDHSGGRSSHSCFTQYREPVARFVSCYNFRFIQVNVSPTVPLLFYYCSSLLPVARFVSCYNFRFVQNPPRVDNVQVRGRSSSRIIRG